MRHAKVTIVALLLGVCLLGAYFGVRGQDPRLPWPPAPVVPPANFEESEPPPDRPAAKLPVPRPITPPELVPNSPIVPTRFEQPAGPDLPAPAPIQVEVMPPPLPTSTQSEPKKKKDAPKSDPKSAPPPLKSVMEEKANDLIVLPPGPMPFPVVVQSTPEAKVPLAPLPKPAIRPQAPAYPDARGLVPGINPSGPAPKLKAFQLVNPVRHANAPLSPAPLESPPSLERSMVQALPVAQSNPSSSSATFSGNATPQLTIDKRGPAAAHHGDSMQFTILVRNVGTNTATQVKVEDEIPAGTRVIGCEPQPVQQSDRAIWIIPALAPGAEKLLMIELQARDGGDVVSSTSVWGGATATLRTRVRQDNSSRLDNSLAQETLSLIVKAPASVTVGSQVVFEVVVTNHGKAELTKVVLHGMLPPGLTHSFGQEIEADVSNLVPGVTKPFKMPVTAAKVGRQTVDVKITAGNGVEATGQATVEVLPRAFPGIRNTSSMGSQKNTPTTR